MAPTGRQVIDLVLDKLSADGDLLNRFLDAPVEVIGEITDQPVDQAMLDAIGDGLRERFGDASELSDEQLEQAPAAGISYTRISSWKPVIGSSPTFTTVMTDI